MLAQGVKVPLYYLIALLLRRRRIAHGEPLVRQARVVIAARFRCHYFLVLR